MTKKFLLTLITTSALAILPTYHGVADETVATYKGTDIKDTQVMDYIIYRAPALKNKKLSDFDANVQNLFVKEFIYLQLSALEAKANNLDTSKDFQAKAALARNELLKQEYLDDYITKHFNEKDKKEEIEKEINKEYDSLVQSLKGKKEVELRQVFLPISIPEARAKEILKQLQSVKPQEFIATAERLVKNENKKLKVANTNVAKANEDTEDMENRNARICHTNSLGFVREGQAGPEFDSVAFSLEKNKLGMIKSDRGYHILRRENIRDVVIPTKEQARAALIEKIKNDLLLSNYEQLAEKYQLKINTEKLVPASTPTAPVTPPPAPAAN